MFSIGRAVKLGLVGAGLYFLFRKSSFEGKVDAVIHHKPLLVWKSLVDPAMFYTYNGFGEGVNKVYTPTITSRTEDTIVYDLDHSVTWSSFLNFKQDIKSTCYRENISQQNLTFSEHFTKFGATLRFDYKFKERSDGNTDAHLKINVEGVWIMVRLFGSRVEKDFEWKFGLVDRHLPQVIISKKN